MIPRGLKRATARFVLPLGSALNRTYCTAPSPSPMQCQSLPNPLLDTLDLVLQTRRALPERYSRHKRAARKIYFVAILPFFREVRWRASASAVTAAVGWANEGRGRERIKTGGDTVYEGGGIGLGGNAPSYVPVSTVDDAWTLRRELNCEATKVPAGRRRRRRRRRGAGRAEGPIWKRRRPNSRPAQSADEPGRRKQESHSAKTQRREEGLECGRREERNELRESETKTESVRGSPLAPLRISCLSSNNDAKAVSAFDTPFLVLCFGFRFCLSNNACLRYANFFSVRSSQIKQCLSTRQ